MITLKQQEIKVKRSGGFITNFYVTGFLNQWLNFRDSKPII